MQFPTEIQPKFDKLNIKLKEMRLHSVFSSIQSLAELQFFMSWHVFAVWDFMSLAKRLQNEFTCVTVPWMPPEQSKAARLVNEIILGEETDTLPNGQSLSHFEMYLLAMGEIGAEPTVFNTFFANLKNGQKVEDALNAANVDDAIKNFVTETINTATYGSVAEVLGSFFYGREDSIPQMFDHLLKTWNIDESEAPTFVYYLNRHIELDGDTHGPAVQMIMNDKLGNDVIEWNDLFDAAITAVELRIELWDALEVALIKRREGAAA